ncbi:hypothetical protein [Nitrosarchaeum sp. AC2]|uniref:hypothetical protein n=1 Tax=Nitrosarchaeum sp. AC2 TaxID=2259673 RepID=UPI0015C78A1F|nr:hypothetical protein [Nitrosarchaeum sp. AC2]QLH11250.1 hypothetical protein DSQ20_07100 [Nitrosarchaeum sp. AC2]
MKIENKENKNEIKKNEKIKMVNKKCKCDKNEIKKIEKIINEKIKQMETNMKKYKKIEIVNVIKIA